MLFLSLGETGRITSRHLRVPSWRAVREKGHNEISTDFPFWNDPVLAESERKLTAIMFTDVVGYTALAQRDEHAAMSLLERHDELLRPVIARSVNPST